MVERPYCLSGDRAKVVLLPNPLDAKGTTMYSTTIDGHGNSYSDGKDPLLRVVRTTPMERFSWLVTGVIMLATGVILLTDKTERSSTVELVLLWTLVLSGIKLTILGAVGRYPLPRWLNVLVPNPPK